MTAPLHLALLTLGGVELTNELSVSWPVLVVIVGLGVLSGKALHQVSVLTERVGKLEVRQDATTVSQTASDNRLTRLETTMLHVQQTTDRTHALVQAMAAGLKAA